MSSERTRERILELVREMSRHTVANGCTPGEAAKFAAKVAEYIERYQIEDAELRGKDTEATHEEIEVCENYLRTGKKCFNPGMTQVVNGLAEGMSCKCILLHRRNDDGEMEAVYGITGEVLDATYVCQVAMTVVPALQVMARLEGIEHGYEKAGLVRWTNQYLTGAGQEIRKRLEAERKDRAEAKAIEHARSCTGLVLVTGETLAIEKKAATLEVFNKAYPKTRQTHSRSEYDHTANQRGREAGKRVGLNIAIE